MGSIFLLAEPSLSPGNRAEGRRSEWETRLFVEEPMLSTGLHFASESTLLLHLLKWRYQPDKRGPSWEASIRVQRNPLADHLDDNPSLKPAPAAGARLRLSRRGAGGGRGDGAGG